MLYLQYAVGSAGQTWAELLNVLYEDEEPDWC